jgi:hypothetical protein
MRSKRILTIALGLAVLVGLGSATYVAMAQVNTGTNTAGVAEYEKRLAAIDRNKVDDLYALAKWCYVNGLTGEAKSLALETLQKSPEDVRAKYLLYVLTAGTATEVVVGTGHEVVEVEAGISDADADAIYTREGDKVMTPFRDVQRLLLTSCGAPKCHGGQNPQSKWSLVRRDPTSRKTIAENFRTVDRYIDRDAPTDSKLLKMPASSKPTHPEIVFRGGAADPVYLKILPWIKTLKTATGSIWEEASKAAPPAATSTAPTK